LFERDLLAMPDSQDTAAWRALRQGFFVGLEGFLGGRAEGDLLRGYQDVQNSEALEGAGAAQLQALKDAVARSFAQARDLQRRTLEARNEAETVLRDAFCIVGYAAGSVPGSAASASPTESGDERNPTPSAAEAAVILYHSVLSGRYIGYVEASRLRSWLIVPALVLAAILAPLGLALTLIVGILASAIMGVASAVLLIRFGLLIPLEFPIGLMLGATLVSAAVFGILSLRRSLPLRKALAHRVSRKSVAALVRSEDFVLKDIRIQDAVVVAVRYQGNLEGLGEGKIGEGGTQAVEAFRTFQERSAREIIRMNGAVLGAEGGVLLGAFGTPLDQGTLGNRSAAESACAAVREMAAGEDALEPKRRFGMAAGTCAFSYTGFGSYAALGQAVVHARLLSRLAERYEAVVLINRALKEALSPDWETRALDSMVEKASGQEESFYELTGAGRRLSS
jgi:hypothetical protein